MTRCARAVTRFLSVAIRGGLLLAVLLAMLGSGCARAPESPARVARFRPDDSTRQPWRWDDGAAAAPAPIRPTTAESPAESPAEPPRVPSDSAFAQRPLRIGDKMIVYLRGIPEPDEVQDIVDDLGEISLPLLGNVRVDGRTTAEIERLITTGYIEGGFYRQINVSVVSQENEYFVRGEVKREGRYPISGDLTLTQAIITAGGYTDYAKPAAVRIIRGREVLEFDCTRIEKRQEQDPYLQSGDTVIVPRRLLLP